MDKVIVFDVNGTLLDLSAMDPLFSEVFGSTQIRERWFSQVLISAMLATITNKYQPFTALARGALKGLAVAHATELDGSTLQRFADAMSQLLPYEDAVPALEQLRSAGLRLAALTNSPQAAAEAKLTHAGLRCDFEQVLSVEAIRCYKPAAATYRHAASQLGVETSAITLVAAHDWDVIGAMRAGCCGVFVARPGKLYDPDIEPPDIVGTTLMHVADKIIKKNVP